MHTDHWNNRALDFVRPHFDQTQCLARIATGFFTVQGFDLVRRVLAGKRVQLLVGFDEKSKERLRQKLIEDIMLHLGQWSAEDRRAAVLDLVERIRQGRFVLAERQERDERIDARARSRDHAKVFILDGEKVIVGSINLTESGLLYNAEGCSLVDDPERVRFFVESFERYWNDEHTYDLTEALLQALLAWLQLRPPFDVYLKAIQTLIHEEEVEPPRETYKMPVEYQQVVIARVLRQLKEYRGAMLVASTGLGKTVMATHAALRLDMERKTMNYLVFAPKQIHPDWKRAMKSAGLSGEVFTRELLDRAENAKGLKTTDLYEALDQLDDRYLVIIDESQYFRNQLRAIDGRKRHSFKRLMDRVARKKPFILLLTATPFSKDIRDLNNQLLLLPHTAEKKYVTAKGQFVFPGMVDDLIAPEAWKVPENEQYFQHFLELPVSTVISTSQVAKDFAEKTPEGEFIVFGTEKRWIPQIAITKVSVPLLLEEQMAQVLRDRVFEHKRMFFRHRDTWRASTTTIQKEAEVAWTSSPRALADVIRHTIEKDGYEVRFITSEEKRREHLTPLLDILDGQSYDEDPKLVQLTTFLKNYKAENRKVIIFTERLSTAIYLEQALKEKAPGVAVANCVADTPEGPALKDFDREVLTLIKGFAPVANADKISPREKLTPYDVFISTDAYSTGVNLQDASVVINYDLAWTPDVIIQRAGRILRFWHQPRRVDFIVFVGDIQDKNLARHTRIVENRLDKLTGRSRHAEKFSELPLLPEAESARFDNLSALSSIKIEHLGLAEPGQIEEFSGVSPFLRHVAVLQENRAYAETLPDDISSAMVYSSDKPLIFLLLDCQGQAEIVLYDVQDNRLITKKEDELLSLIQCGKDTPVAEIDADRLEKLAQRAKRFWMEHRQLERDMEVSRICALYLVPKEKETGLDKVLERKT
ncbi:MAG: hypothetical protein EPGJADBJ_04211 [Saprospiraceae bacterium]|nr:hypothetical protein [Saprospiraceae bacterium]